LNIEGKNFIKLTRDFYEREPVTLIARELIGKYLFSSIEGELTGGRIVETEAYDGRRDKACHAFLKRTTRTEVMYEKGGLAYVYLCYGIHHLFNIVTNREGFADAVLIRAIEPVYGVELMKVRRNKTNILNLGNGPGILTQSLSISKNLTGLDLVDSQLWIGELDNDSKPKVLEDRRIGVDYAEEDALLPWRFLEADNKWVSRKKQKDVNRN
jgi:DNA-3-methyladenine glycosylase